MNNYNEDIKKLMQDLVDCKVAELQSWAKVRWEGGRLYHETNKIIKEIAEYDIHNQILYLELLVKKEFRIFDNWPSSAPEITSQFYNWINSRISKLKIKLMEIDKQNKERIYSAKNKEDFLRIFIKGIHELQQQGDKAPCVENIKNKKLLEAPFQYYFKTFFASIYDSVEAEPQKGNGRIDLKIRDKTIGIKIVEFKGWWHSSKNTIVEQICNYLTDFEKEGYIFIINNNKTKNIINDYKDLITVKETNYITDSWESIIFNKSNFEYFFSRHRLLNKEKIIYHFIFNVFNKISHRRQHAC